MTVESTNPVAVPDPMTAVLRDAGYLVRRIAEVSDCAAEDVVRRLAMEQASLGTNVAMAVKQWDLQPYVWSDRLLEFYRTTDAFLYETIVWNRTSQKNEMRRWIATFLARRFAHGARVLTFGDGLGFDSQYLATAGHEVDYYDVSDDAGAFARTLFADFHNSVRILSGADEVVADAYDVCVCLDVLEHIPEPAGVVESLARAIRPGGYLIVHAPFWYLSRAVATHLRENRKYSGDVKRLYQPFGLRPVDGNVFWNPLVLQKQGQSSQQSNVALPYRVRLGGWLLAWARYWAVPHVLVLRWMLARGRTPWQELEALRAEYE